MTTTLARTGSALAAAGLLIGMLSACTPQAEPTPKPTKSAAFASANLNSVQAATAAAEATYRGYLTSSNEVDLAAPETFESVFQWLAGDALASARESYSAMRADGLTLTGESTFDRFDLVSHTDEEVVAELCADVSMVNLTNEKGDSVISPNRVPRQRVEVQFVRSATPSGLAITRSTVVQESSC